MDYSKKQPIEVNKLIRRGNWALLTDQTEKYEKIKKLLWDKFGYSPDLGRKRRY